MKLILLTLVISLGACEFTTTRKGGGSSDRVALPLNFTTAKDIQNGQALLFSDSDSIVSETGKMVNRLTVPMAKSVFIEKGAWITARLTGTLDGIPVSSEWCSDGDIKFEFSGDDHTLVFEICKKSEDASDGDGTEDLDRTESKSQTPSRSSNGAQKYPVAEDIAYEYGSECDSFPTDMIVGKKGRVGFKAKNSLLAQKVQCRQRLDVKIPKGYGLRISHFEGELIAFYDINGDQPKMTSEFFLDPISDDYFINIASLRLSMTESRLRSMWDEYEKTTEFDGLFIDYKDGTWTTPCSHEESFQQASISISHHMTGVWLGRVQKIPSFRLSYTKDCDPVVNLEDLSKKD